MLFLPGQLIPASVCMSVAEDHRKMIQEMLKSQIGLVLKETSECSFESIEMHYLVKSLGNNGL